jgi:hypothetical protein
MSKSSDLSQSVNPLSVPGTRLEDSTVTAAKLEDSAVTTAKLEDLAVTAAKLEDLAVTTAKLEDSAVTTAKLEDSSITDDKISSVSSSKVTYQRSGNHTYERDVENKLQEVVSILDYVPENEQNDVLTGVTDATDYVQKAINQNKSNSVIDFAFGTFRLTSAVSIDNASNLTLRNGTFRQYTETEHILHYTGGFSSRCSLESIFLNHEFNTATAGSCVYINGGNRPFFRWAHGSTNGGRHGLRTNGGSWMMHIERVWSLNAYQSGFCIASTSAQTIPWNTAAGGTTTTKLYKCFVTDIQTNGYAYEAYGVDTFVMEQCSADRCLRFGQYRVKALSLLNCSMEQIDYSAEGPIVSGTHNLIRLHSGNLATINGFHIVFENGFVPPTPTPGNHNSFVSSLNSQYTVECTAGAFPAAGGYLMSRQEGGKSFILMNGASGLGSVLAFAGGVTKNFDDLLV